MNKFDFRQDFLAIKRILENIKNAHSPFVLWQITEGKRVLKLVYIESNLFDHQIVWLRAEEGSAFSLTPGWAYLYCSAKQVVGKVKIKMGKLFQVKSFQSKRSMKTMLPFKSASILNLL